MTPSLIVLLIANAVPIAGVLFLGWSVFPLVLLYWLENVVVGGFNVAKLLTAQPSQPVYWVVKLFLVPFFVLHFGMFTYVHGIFVLGLFGGAFAKGGFNLSPLTLLTAIRQAGVGWGVAALVASHGFSFFHNYLMGGEYRRVGLSQLMGQPYGRVVVLHFAILGGGFIVMALGSAVVALILLIVVKTAIDLAAHLAERRKLGAAPDQALFATTSS